MKNGLLCFVFGLLVCSISSVQAQQKATPKTLLWRISGNNLQKPSYLFGTMHLTDKKLFFFGDSLYSCLESAEGFAMEIDPDSAVMSFFQSMDEEDNSGLLKDVLTKKELEKFGKHLEKEFGVSVNKVTLKKAFLYGYSWADKLNKGDKMETPVDTYLYNIAKKQGKWVGGIEDLSDYWKLYKEVDPRLMIGGLLEDDRGKKSLDKLIEIYINQDLDKIYELEVGFDKRSRDALLVNRNVKMAHRMDSMAALRSNFFAVGAAHLPGHDGIIEMLRQKGYKVEPVFSSAKISPEAYTYKAVELPWFEVQDEEKTFSVNMPGKAFPFKTDGQVTMQTYADVGTGIVYLATSIETLKISNPDSMLTVIAKNMVQAGKQESKQRIKHKGSPGLEFYFKRDDNYYRLQAFIKGKFIYMIMLGSRKKEALKQNEQDRFFSSLLMKGKDGITASSKKYAWEVYKNENKGFEIKTPGEFVPNAEVLENFKKNPLSAMWKLECFTHADDSSELFLMLMVKETAPGYHIADDTALFYETRLNAEKGFAKSISLYKTFTYLGYPALRMNAEYKDGNFMMEALTVNRGDRCYLAMVVRDKNNNTKYVDTFLNSLNFIEYKKPAWNIYSSPDNFFRTWAPAGITYMTYPKEEGEDTTAISIPSYIAYDSLSGMSFQVEKKPISPYYWTNADSTFFDDHSSNYIGWQDSVLEKKAIQNGAVKGMEYIVKSPVISNIKRLRYLPVGDTLYVLYTLMPQSNQRDSDYDKFFTEFKFAKDVANVTYLTNKTSKLLNDLLSKDSATFHTASGAIRSAAFTRADLPMLHKALLEPYQDFDINYNSTHDKLLDEIVDLEDSSTVLFIRDNYNKLPAEKEILKYSLLSVLTRLTTKESYDLFKSLVLESAPLKGSALMLQHSLRDSLALTATLFPELLQKSTDTIFIKTLPIVLNQLLDSNLLSVDKLSLYKTHYFEYAKRELDRLQQEEENYDYLADDLVEFLGKMNDAAANKLLYQFLDMKQMNIKEIAAVGLIKNNQPVDAMVLEKIAADYDYRSSLFTQLKDAGKENLFPQKYASQKSIAESEIYHIASDDYEPKTITYIGERTAMFMGKKQKFLLFKITYEYDEGEKETYLGITGPYDLNSKKIITDTDASGLYSEETFDVKKLDKQFKARIEQIESYRKEKLLED